MNEREELDALIRSEGWAVFRRYVAREWGSEDDGGGVRFLAAVRQASSERAEADATEKLRQIVVAQREIHRVMAWVDERLKQLTKKDPAEARAAAMSRRGAL